MLSSLSLWLLRMLLKSKGIPLQVYRRVNAVLPVPA